MDVRESCLTNGMRVVTASIPHVESVSLGIWVGAGSRYERERESGISHFLEHMLFKGTKKRSAVDISRAIEGRGGYLNAFTQAENTCYYTRVAYDRQCEGLEILADMFLNSRLDESEVMKERGVIVEEIMMYRDQPHHRVQEMLGEALWTDHPLGRPVSGWPETVGKVKRQDLSEFKRAKYVPGNTVVAYAGRIEHDKCVEETARCLGRMRARRRPRCRRVTQDTGQARLAIEAKDAEQAHVAMGWRLFGRDDPRRFVLKVLSVILGENMSSRLFQTIREKHGLAYSVQSCIHLVGETGALTVSAGLEKTRYQKAVKMIVREMRKLKQSRVGVRELGRAKDYAIGQLRLALESTSSQMMWIGENIMFHGRFMSPEETISSIKAVTSDDVQQLASEVLRPGNLSIAVVAPGIDAPEARALKGLANEL